MNSIFEYENMPNMCVFAILQPSLSSDVANTINCCRKMLLMQSLLEERIC